MSSMWKSVIRDYPDEQDEWGTGFNPLFLDYAEALVREPWLVALQDIVAWTKIWTGTEEALMEEIRFRVNRELWESEDFPSDFERLRYYYGVAWEVSHAISSGGLRLNVFRYDELSKKDLEEFDVPGWGPEAPLLVERDGAGRRPGYTYTTIKLMKYEDPLLLAFQIFTDSTKFVRGGRRWSGSTDELLGVLNAYYPSPGYNCRVEHADVEWASGEGVFAFYDHSCRELIEDFYLFDPSDYRRFHTRMKTYAGILEEVGIKLSKKKVTRTVREPGGEARKTKQTRWTVEGPRWLS